MASNAQSPRSQENDEIDKDILTKKDKLRLEAISSFFTTYNFDIHENAVKRVVAEKAIKADETVEEKNSEFEQSQSQSQIIKEADAKDIFSKAKTRFIPPKTISGFGIKKMPIDVVITIFGCISLILNFFDHQLYYAGNEDNFASTMEQIDSQKELIEQMSDTELSEYYSDTGILLMTHRYKHTPLNAVYRSGSILCSLFIVVLLFIQLIKDFRINLEKGKATSDSKLIKSQGFKIFLLESFVILINNIPFVDKVMVLDQMEKHITISSSTIVSSIAYVKVYLLFRMFGKISEWRNNIAEKYCEMEGCEANTGFAIKAVLKRSPLLALLVALLVSTSIFGIILFNFERPMNEELCGTGQNFSVIWNGMWLAVVTMTTVGFGDYFAQSHFGRVVTVLVIFWGIFLMSLLVVALTNEMDLDHKESRAYTILYRLQSRKELEHKAARVLTIAIRIIGLEKDLTNRIKDMRDEKEKEELISNSINTRASYISNLEFYKGLYFEELKNLGSADDDPVEEIKKISLTIDHDFLHLKRLLLIIKEIEVTLQSLEASHETILKIIKEVKVYNNLFQEEFKEFKGGIFGDKDPK